MLFRAHSYLTFLPFVHMASFSYSNHQQHALWLLPFAINFTLSSAHWSLISSVTLTLRFAPRLIPSALTLTLRFALWLLPSSFTLTEIDALRVNRIPSPSPSVLIGKLFHALWLSQRQINFLQFFPTDKNHFDHHLGFNSK
jgi:hypothetical protein